MCFSTKTRLPSNFSEDGEKLCFLTSKLFFSAVDGDANWDLIWHYWKISIFGIGKVGPREECFGIVEQSQSFFPIKVTDREEIAGSGLPKGSCSGAAKCASKHDDQRGKVKEIRDSEHHVCQTVDSLLQNQEPARRQEQTLLDVTIDLLVTDCEFLERK